MSKRSDCPLRLRVEKNRKTGMWGDCGPPMLVTPTELGIIRSMLKGRRVNDSPEGSKLAEAGRRIYKMEGQLKLDVTKRRHMSKEELTDELGRETYVQQILRDIGMRDSYLENVIGKVRRLIKEKAGGWIE